VACVDAQVTYFIRGASNATWVTLILDRLWSVLRPLNVVRLTPPSGGAQVKQRATSRIAVRKFIYTRKFKNKATERVLVVFLVSQSLPVKLAAGIVASLHGSSSK
jgi:hypothetical protein